MEKIRVKISDILKETYSDGIEVKQPDTWRDSQRIVDLFSKWISVEERLPRAGIAVLTCRRDGGIEKDGMMTGFKEDDYWIVARAENCVVTHWMTLPEPPK